MEKVFLQLCDTLPRLEENLPYAVRMIPELGRVEDKGDAWVVEGRVVWQAFFTLAEEQEFPVFLRPAGDDGGFGDWRDDEEEAFSQQGLSLSAPPVDPKDEAGLERVCEFRTKLPKPPGEGASPQVRIRGIHARPRREGYRIVVEMLLAVEILTSSEGEWEGGHRDWAALRLGEDIPGEVLDYHLALEDLETRREGESWRLRGRMAGKAAILAQDGEIRLIEKKAEGRWRIPSGAAGGPGRFSGRLSGVEIHGCPEGSMELSAEVLFAPGRTSMRMVADGKGELKVEFGA